MNIIITEILESQRCFGEAIGLAKGLSMNIKDDEVKEVVNKSLNRLTSFQFSDKFWEEINKFNILNSL